MYKSKTCNYFNFCFSFIHWEISNKHYPIYLDWNQSLIATHIVMKGPEKWLNNLMIWLCTISRHKNAAATLSPVSCFSECNFNPFYSGLCYAAKMIFSLSLLRETSDQHIWFIKRIHIFTQFSSWNNWSKRRLSNSFTQGHNQHLQCYNIDIKNPRILSFSFFVTLKHSSMHVQADSTIIIVFDIIYL